MGTQFARLVMSYIDCDTIPFFWQYANRFTLFDNIFATEDTPSTPNAIAMIAGQSGETQWVKHGHDGHRRYAVGEQRRHDAGAAAGQRSRSRSGARSSTPPKPTASRAGRRQGQENYANTNIASNLTFATLPLTFAGAGVAGRDGADRAPGDRPGRHPPGHPVHRLARRQAGAWRWYQNGYDHEPTDPAGVATHAGYVSHHNGAAIFRLHRQQPGAARQPPRAEGDFFADLQSGNLPTGGGVFYIRGGFTQYRRRCKPPIQNPRFPNPAGLTAAEIAAINAAKSGDDDHPSYTDRQISEAMAARVINAVASKPEIWSQSAIIITYDESDGFYDHVPPRILSYGPDGLPLARGIRIPMIVISPYARAHVVSHAEGDHNAVIETIDAIFDLPPLASLPDEAQALLAGRGPGFNGPERFRAALSRAARHQHAGDRRPAVGLRAASG